MVLRCAANFGMIILKRGAPNLPRPEIPTMSNVITIPTVQNRYNDKGHFESPAIIMYLGGRGAPRQHKIGGWDETGKGRKCHGGDMAAGPYMFTYEATLCIDADGRSGREFAALDAKGLIVRVQGGETLEIAGIKYHVEPGHPYLHLVELPGV